MTDVKNQEHQRLYEALEKISSKDEACDFLIDICTMGEIEAMSQRLHVAELLTSGEKFDTIQKKTGASTATISRVNRAVKYGTGGYKSIIDKLSEDAD